MPTNDERREVAARLRDYADPERTNNEIWWGLQRIAYGGDYSYLYHASYELLKRLADLIEPEPQRTCRNLGKDFTCSECGANVCGGSFCHSYCDSDGTRWYTTKNPPNWNYCPTCGAKVVE